MVKRTDDEENETRAVMRLLPVGVVRKHEPDVMERCYQIWAGSGAMSASATEHRYAKEVEPDVPVPTARTIREWAKDHGWYARRDEEFVRNHGERLFEIQMRDLLLYEAAGERFAEVLAGVYNDNPYVGIMMLRARELLGRENERKAKPLIPALPEGSTTKWDDMPLEQQEAFLRGETQRRKAAGGNG